MPGVLRASQLATPARPRCLLRRLSASLVVVNTLLVLALTTAAYGDPSLCRVVVEEPTKTGLRISDAQKLTTDVMGALRGRYGQAAVVFEGTVKSQEKMNRMLGRTAETSMEPAQIQYYRAAIANARYWVGVSFGRKKGKEWIELGCRDKTLEPAPADKPAKKRSKAAAKRAAAKARAASVVEKVRFEDRSFKKARDKMLEALPTFCTAIGPSGAPAPAAASPQVKPGVQAKPSKPKGPWVPPPRRD
jgi:hypothetical protein